MDSIQGRFREAADLRELTFFTRDIKLEFCCCQLENKRLAKASMIRIVLTPRKAQ